jgi:acetyl esterase
MALDPQLQPILEFVNPIMVVDGKTAAEARAGMSGGMPLDETGLAEVRDLTVAGEVGELPARLYRPEGAAPGGPVVVFFHGGGWVIGSIASHDNVCGRMAAESGCTVISVDYRLAPETKFPGAAEDAYAATSWVAAHADELGVDASRLAVAGDSAGGNLAAVTSLLARERGGPAIAFQLLIYPVTDLSQDYPSHAENGPLGYLLTTNSMTWFAEHYVGGVDDVDWRAAPITASAFDGLPPALVITAELDPLRDEGEAYAGKLEAAGVPVTTQRYDGMCHGFLSFPVDGATAAREAIATALRGALRP